MSGDLPSGESLCGILQTTVTSRYEVLSEMRYEVGTWGWMICHRWQHRSKRLWAILVNGTSTVQRLPYVDCDWVIGAVSFRSFDDEKFNDLCKKGLMQQRRQAAKAAKKINQSPRTGCKIMESMATHANTSLPAHPHTTHRNKSNNAAMHQEMCSWCGHVRSQRCIESVERFERWWCS